MNGYVPSPVLYKPSQLGENPVAVYFLKNDPMLCYEFSWRRVSKDGQRITYMCRACGGLKKQADQNPFGHPVYGTAPTVVIEQDMFTTDPENTRHPHFCTPYEAPAAMMRREQLGVVQALRNSFDNRTPRQVEQQLMAAVDNTYLATGKENLRRQVQRNKQAARNAAPRPVPGQLDPDLAKCTADMERFILKDEPECLLLGSRTLIETLFGHFNPVAILADGRFKQVPLEYQGQSSQIYSVFLEVEGGHAFLLLVAILTGSTEQHYDIVFGALNDELQRCGLITSMRKAYFLSDYELAAMNSAARNLRILVRGCWFHFTQCLLRKKRSLGLAGGVNASISRYFDRLNALPFIPESLFGTSEVLMYPKAPLVTAAEEAQLAKFHDYMELTWLSPQGTFADLWSHYNNYGPRTSNIVEGSHNAISSHFMNERSPKLTDILGFFSREISLHKSKLSPLFHGTLPPRYVRPDEVDRQTMIHDAMTDFDRTRMAAYPAKPSAVVIRSFLDEIRRLI